MKGNIFTNYIKSSFEELSKVVWPTRNQAAMLTLIVVIFCIVFAALLGAFDLLFNKLFSYLINLTA